MFGDPVQHSEARDEVSSVEQRRVLSEQRVDVRPGARRPLHQPGVLPGLQRDQRLTRPGQTPNLINVDNLGIERANIVVLCLVGEPLGLNLGSSSRYICATTHATFF